MKILIRGAGFENKGAEAMLRVVQREVGRRINSCLFFASVHHHELPFSYGVGILPLWYAPSIRMQLLRSMPLFGKIPQLVLGQKNPHFAAAIKHNSRAAYEINHINKIDAVIDVSGFAYSDSCGWGANAVKETWAWVEYCKAIDKPYIVLPQAFGPFQKEEISFWSKRIFENSALCFSRDDESSGYLAKLRGLPMSEVRQAPDIAFLFNGDSAGCGCNVLKNLGLRFDRPIIGIVPNMRVYERTSGSGANNQYVKLLVSLVDHCTEGLGADVLLAPNEIKTPGALAPDDRYLCGTVAAQVKNVERCRSLRDYHSSETVKAIIGQLDLLIASRFHSLVFGLTEGVPAVALGWSHKYQELFKPFGIERFVVDHDDLNFANIISLVDEAWHGRENTKAGIQAVVPQLKTQVDKLFDEVAGVIIGGNL